MELEESMYKTFTFSHIVGSYTPLSYHLSQNQLVLENGTTMVLW